MEWLSELIKHITISRPFTGAVFITSALLVSGPKWFPSYFDPLPKEFLLPVTASLIFSGALLFIWFAPTTWILTTNAALTVPHYFRSKTLTESEQLLMLIVATRADDWLNLRNIDYEERAASKLEVLAMSLNLARKGLVEINMYDENLIKLSTLGRKRAIELKNKTKAVTK